MKTQQTRVDWLAVGLLLALVLTSVGRLGVTRWIPELDRVQTLAVIAALVGMALGRSIFQRRMLIALSTGYGLTLVPSQLVRIMDPEMEFGQRLLNVGGRLLYSAGEFSRGSPVQDPIFFLTLLMLVYWVIGLTAGYYLLRHGNFLASVLPLGFIMLVVQVYDFYPVSRVWFLGFYVFLALVLLGRINYLRSQSTWQKRRVFFSPESGLDLTSGTAIAAAAIILAAWIVPGLSYSPAAAKVWDSVTEPWRVIRDRLGDAFAAAEGGVGVGTEFFGDSLVLGTGSPLSKEIMFKVHIPSSQGGVPRFYWRGRVYDQYMDREWSSTAVETHYFDPAMGNAPIPDLVGRRILDFTFTVYGRQGTLYLPSQPLWINRPAAAKLITLPGDRVDVAFLRTPENMEAGETYQARAAIATPTIVQLRTAGDEYPDWVTDRYLQLPENFSPAIQKLARQVTEGAATPYDKTKAVTDYLRMEIEYTTSIPAPIGGRDPLEYFLFDIKRGFCNYYASAEVLMLRSVGVPARMAVGFAQGESDLSGTTFTVLHRDAHAWPEVYFPGIGWVEFEPTSSQSTIVRPSGLPASGNNGFQNPLSRLSEEGERFPGSGRPAQEDVGAEVAGDVVSTRQQVTLRIFLLVLVLVCAGIFWYLNRRYAWLEQAPVLMVRSLERRAALVPDWLRNWAFYAQAGPVARAFETINTSLRWLGETPPIHATPAQRARVLTDLMPDAAPVIQILAEEQQAGQYSPRPADPARARRASLDLWGYTMRTIIRRWFTSIQERF